MSFRSITLLLALAIGTVSAGDDDKQKWENVCKNNGCINLRNGASLESDSGVEAGAGVSNVHQSGCCDICATVSTCNYWSHTLANCNGNWVCRLHQVAGAIGYKSDNVYGEVASTVTRTCWSETRRYRFVDGSALQVSTTNTTSGCCSECRKYSGSSVAAFPGCTYWVLNENTNQCYLYSNYDLVTIEANSAKGDQYTSGYISVTKADVCHAKTGVAYLGPHINEQPAHPVTPAQCCSLCRTTTGCKAFTWSPDGTGCFSGSSEYVNFFTEGLGEFTGPEGRRGVCFLLSEAGAEVNYIFSAVSGTVD